MSFDLKILRDWLGDGGRAVPPEKSESRAKICMSGENGGLCSENRAPQWWETATNEVALVIRKELEFKNKLSMRVSCEDKLAMCRVCGCALPLKVHVPIEHVKTHLKADDLKRFPQWCWIRSEIEKP